MRVFLTKSAEKDGIEEFWRRFWESLFVQPPYRPAPVSRTAPRGENPNAFSFTAPLFTAKALEKLPENKLVSAPKRDFLSGVFANINQNNIAARGMDIASGALLTSAARYGSMALMGGAGLTGLPLIAAGAVAAGVARTAWKIHKDRKAHVLEHGTDVPFWEWLGQSKSQYLKSFATSTVFATVGSGFMGFALPHLETAAHTVAPLFEKIAPMNLGVSVSGFFSGLFNGAKAEPLIVEDAQLTSFHLPQSIVHLAQAHQPAGEDIVDRALTTGNAEMPMITEPDDVPVEAVAPSSMNDRLSALLAERDVSTRWQNIVESAIEGDAQAQKDTAMSLLNGINGFGKDQALALELYNAAAEAGNMQAKIDLAYITFHGLPDVVEADRGAALETLAGYAETSRAARTMLEHLTDSASGAAEKAAVMAPEDMAAESYIVSETRPAPMAAAVASVPARAPDLDSLQGCKFEIDWQQSANGGIEGVVENPPECLKSMEGMTVEVPVVRI